MPLSEADTRSKLIDPVLYQRGWTEAHLRREETAGEIVLVAGKPRKRQGRVDYTLRLQVNSHTQPVAVALIEAKADDAPPTQGLEQAKRYARLLNVPFVFSSNGHLFVEHDFFTGTTSDPQPLAAFPSPTDLHARYEQGKGFTLQDPAARPLLTPYTSGEGQRRYYQDAAIRAVFEHVAQANTRALLTLATGAGKTYIAVNLLKRIADAGQLRRAVFVCDRDEVERLIEAAYRRSSRYGLIVKTLFYTGARVSEFVHIQVHDLHLSLDPPQIYLAHAKGGSDGSVPILAVLAHELRMHLAGRQRGYLFESNRSDNYTPRYIQRVVHTATIHAGIHKCVTPHRLRASIATILLNAGMPLDQVQKFLRHKCSTTPQIYAETSVRSMGEQYVRAFTQHEGA